MNKMAMHMYKQKTLQRIVLSKFKKISLLCSSSLCPLSNGAAPANKMATRAVSTNSLNNICSIGPLDQIQNNYSKTCLKLATQKEDLKLVFKTDYGLMQVKNIAECSKGGAFCNTFDLH